LYAKWQPNLLRQKRGKARLGGVWKKDAKLSLEVNALHVTTGYSPFGGCSFQFVHEARAERKPAFKSLHFAFLMAGRFGMGNHERW
jgi:hypothetical protein